AAYSSVELTAAELARLPSYRACTTLPGDPPVRPTSADDTASASATATTVASATWIPPGPGFSAAASLRPVWSPPVMRPHLRRACRAVRRWPPPWAAGP